MSKTKLTPMQFRFKEFLLADPRQNLTQAALKAGCTPKSAPVQGSKWLKLPQIQAALAEKTAKIASDLQIDQEWVLRRLKMLSDFDVRKFYDADGNLKKPSELDDETAFALQGLEVEKLFDHFGKGAAKEVGTTTKIKYADKGINLERIGRHLKMFTDKVEVSGMDSIAEELAEARKRISEEAT
jgi:phage terminase small subunit